MMSGYYRDEAATREAFSYGWFHSGDSCAYDDDGLRIMLDRYKDIVKTGGENVSSLRVEAVLAQHPDIDKAVVIGLPHDHWGEAVTAVVIRRPGCEPSPEDIIKFARQALAGYEAPKDVIFTDALPETVGGKVLKYKLRAPARPPLRRRRLNGCQLSGHGKPHPFRRPWTSALARRSAAGCEVDPVGRLAPADEGHGHHLRREQAVGDDPGRR